MKIRDICKYGMKSKIKAGDGLDKGKYKFYTSSSACSKYLNIAQFEEPGIIMGTGGNATLHYSEGDFSVSTDCVVLFPNSNVNSKYLYYFFKKNMKVLEAGFKGAGLKHTSKKYIDEIDMVYIPEVPVQLEVVKTLDKVSNIIDNRLEQLCELDMLIKSQFIEMFGDLAMNPYSWKEQLLSELCKEKDDIKCGPFGTQLSKHEYQKEGVPLWGIPQINAMFKIQPTDYLTKKKAEQLDSYTIIPGDIVMSRKGNVGRCAIYPKKFPLGIMHSDALRIRTDVSLINPDFLVHQLHYSRYVVNQINLVSNGAIMAGINVTKLKSIYIHVPPIELQNQFASFVQQVEKQKVLIQKSLDETQTLFDSLMQKYFG